MTKYLTREPVDNAIDKMGLLVQQGRADASLDIQGKINKIATKVETGEKSDTVGGGARASPIVASRPDSPNGLGHHGEPAEPEEGEEGEPHEREQGSQEENEERAPAKLIRAPRTPSQSERELHEALHLPHAEWCEYCMRGRARNKGHRTYGSGSRARAVPDGDVKGEGPVPNISLDYFFLGDRHPKIGSPTAKLTTRQLKKKLKKI